jgi:hypothetical protein
MPQLPPHAVDAFVRRELAREAVTMALYVALTLLGVLVAVPGDDVSGTLETAAILWGGAAGLALAHWLAFDVAGRLYGVEQLDRLHRLGGPVGLAAALAVALIASIPLLVAPEDVASEAATVVLVLLVAVAGFGVGRRSGAGLVRAAAGGLLVLAVAGVVVGVKIAIGY